MKAPPKVAVMSAFIVTSPTGKQSYTWAQSADASITNAARSDGYQAEVAEPKGGQLTKEKITAKLAELSDDELAELGLSRKKGRKQ